MSKRHGRGKARPGLTMPEGMGGERAQRDGVAKVKGEPVPAKQVPLRPGMSNVLKALEGAGSEGYSAAEIDARMRRITPDDNGDLFGSLDIAKQEALAGVFREPETVIKRAASVDEARARERLAEIATSGEHYRVPVEFADGTVEMLEVDPNRPRTPINSPGEALEAHLRMMTWAASGGGKDLFDRHAAIPTKGEKIDDFEDRQALGEAQRAMFYAALDAGETVYVSPEMAQLTLALAESYGEEVPILHFTDLPAASGMVVLGQPLSLYDVGGELAPYTKMRSFVWSSVAANQEVIHTGGFDIKLTSADGDTATPMQRLLDNGGILIWECYDAGDYLVRPGAFDEWGRPPMVPMRMMAYCFNESEPWVTDHSGPSVRRFIGALFRLIWQRVLYREDWRPNRATARRLNREHRRMPLSGEEIKVTHLRRAERQLGEIPDEDRPEGTGGWKLDHSVPVKGHWRDQWYRSLGPARNLDGSWNEASHRKVWIDPHIRGEGPLLEKYSLTVVNR